MGEVEAFLSGGGEATRMIRARDWSSHPMGAPEQWPEAFKIALSLVLNSPESMILAWGPDLHFFFNEAYFPLLGPRLPWAMGERFDKVWADGWGQAKPIIDEAQAGRSRRFVDLPWTLDTDRGARDTWWTFSYSRVLDADGSVAGLFIFTNETTAQVLANRDRDRAETDVRAERDRARASEAAARQDAERVQLALGAGAIIGTWFWDLPTDRFTVDEAFAVNFGLDPALGRIGLSLAQVVETVHPDDQAGLAAAIDKAVERGGRYAHQYRVRRRDGRYYWLEANGHVEHAPDGTPLRFPGVLIDLEDRRHLVEQRDQALTELRQLNETLERRVAERTAERDRAWRLSHELLVTALPDGTMEAVNPSWTDLLGWRAGELVGAQFFTLTHPDDLPETRAVFADVLQRPLTTPYEYRFRHKDGSYRWFSWTAAFEAGKIYASGRDTTVERHQAEQLIQSQKMEAVGQLTGGLAHDFNNLLAGISGSLELMGTRLSQGRLKDLDRYMTAAQGAATRAAALTHRLLAFSRRQTLAPKPTDVNHLVAGMLDLIQRTVGPSIALEHVGGTGLWPTLVDPSQLENALLNLCINARDAMPGGGKITIETANRWLDHRMSGERELPEGHYLSLCVSDTGTGMAPDVIARAFDPFFTTKPLGQGTGLGLSMIYGFAKQSGGQVRIYSEVDQGTMVCIYLPRHLGEAERPDGIGADRPALLRAERNQTVLVVDDEPTVRLLVTDVLEDLGYTSIEAADGVVGLRILQSDVPVDLLITDIGLPNGLNGRQMFDAARLSRPGLKVLFITGFAENALINNGQLEPGMSVLTKPFSVDALGARIRDLIAGDPGRAAQQVLGDVDTGDRGG